MVRASVNRLEISLMSSIDGLLSRINFATASFAESHGLSTNELARFVGTHLIYFGPKLQTAAYINLALTEPTPLARIPLQMARQRR
jgi:hypothetical protein